jgi:transcriptional regulator with XRE-family HTH domain
MASLRKRFGRSVQQLRKGAKFSQEGFALKAGVARSYMGKIERGEVNVSLDLIERISKGLGVSVGRLFAEVDRLS